MIQSRNLHLLIYTGTLLFSIAKPGLAQHRFYVGGELGVLRSPGLTMVGDSNDRASICDEFINPSYASVPGCTDSARGVGDSWSVPFGGALGTVSSAVIGYRLHPMARDRGRVRDENVELLRERPDPGRRRGQCRQAQRRTLPRRGVAGPALIEEPDG